MQTKLAVGIFVDLFCLGFGNGSFPFKVESSQVIHFIHSLSDRRHSARWIPIALIREERVSGRFLIPVRRFSVSVSPLDPCFNT